MITTVTRRRVEVLVDAPLVRIVRDLAEKAGFKGHTVLPTLGGSGRGGSWSDDQVTGGAGAEGVFGALAPRGAAGRFMDAPAPLLDSHGPVGAAFDVDVIRPQKFS